ncbi:MAG: hypothetical protein HGA45_11360 [Chloroflexales bacterium]|nr:hypothetical protein [Chloroflexales bacterium]
MKRPPYPTGRVALPLFIALAALALAYTLAPARPLGASAMFFPRSQHSATRLPDGRVLVAGGGPATGAEIYDPATDRWSLADAMRVPRQGHGAVLLANGRVLVAGGNQDSQTVEIYDPVADRWGQAAPLLVPRGPVGATLLNDGRVLVVGGNSADAGVEIYDPAANTWTLGAPNPSGALFSSTTVIVLRDGRALVIGLSGYATAITLYSPGTDRWTAISLGDSIPAQAAPLADGRVLILSTPWQQPASAAFLFDPADDTLRPAPPRPCFDLAMTLTPMSDGRLLALGSDLYAPCDTIYDPAGNRWIRARPPVQHRTFFTTTPLGGSVVLLAGAVVPTAGPAVQGDSERYDVAAAAMDKGVFLPMLHQVLPYPNPQWPTVTPYIPLQTSTPTTTPTPTAGPGS